MVIGERVRALRERKNLTQQDIEDRSGLKRCYLSRVENGNTVPSIHTVEKLAAALEVPMYRLFYEGDGTPPDPPMLPGSGKTAAAELQSYVENARLMEKLRRIWIRLDDNSRDRLYSMANMMAERKRAKRAPTRK